MRFLALAESISVPVSVSVRGPYRPPGQYRQTPRIQKADKTRTKSVQRRTGGGEAHLGG
jgi:hypothetical protein